MNILVVNIKKDDKLEETEDTQNENQQTSKFRHIKTNIFSATVANVLRKLKKLVRTQIKQYVEK